MRVVEMHVQTAKQSCHILSRFVGLNPFLRIFFAIFWPPLFATLPSHRVSLVSFARLNGCYEINEGKTMKKQPTKHSFTLGIPSWLWPVLISMVWVIQLAAE